MGSSKMKKVQKNVPRCLVGFNSNAAGVCSAENILLLEGAPLAQEKRLFPPLPSQKATAVQDAPCVWGSQSRVDLGHVWGRCCKSRDSIILAPLSRAASRARSSDVQGYTDTARPGEAVSHGEPMAAAQLLLAAFCPSHSSGINHSCPTLQHSHGDSFQDDLPLTMLPAFVLLFATPT